MIWSEKFAVHRSSITVWRWLKVFFMWIATHFQCFLKFYINNLRHSTQLSSLIVPAKHHLNATECSLLPFYFYVHFGLFQLALRAIWNNLSKEQFSDNAQSRHARELRNQISCSAIAPTQVWLVFCNLKRFCFSGNAWTLFNVAKRMKNHKYETPLDHARRP